MNAAHKLDCQRGEHFRCGARDLTLSRSRCAESWAVRNRDDGSAACRACPAKVRRAVAEGKVELVTAEEVHAGVRPQAIGVRLVIVPDAPAAVKRAAAPRKPSIGPTRTARTGEIVRAITAQPGSTQRVLADATGLQVSYVHALLPLLLADGQVVRTQKRTGPRWVNMYWLAKDKPEPEGGANDRASAAKHRAQRVLAYLAEHPEARGREIAEGIEFGTVITNITLVDLLEAKQVVRIGRGSAGYSWALSGVEAGAAQPTEQSSAGIK